MNKNKTQNELQVFCKASGMEAERLQAKAKAATAGASGSIREAKWLIIQSESRAAAAADGATA